MALAGTTDVKGIIDTVGRFDDAEITSAIGDVEENIYSEIGKPVRAIISDIGKIDNDFSFRYYLGERDLWSIGDVYYGTATKTLLNSSSAYATSYSLGFIRLKGTASAGPVMSNICELEIEFVPKIFHKLAVYRTAKYLLETIDYLSKGEPSRELLVINSRLSEIEGIINRRIGVQLSTTYKNYDPVYGVNKLSLTQNHKRNLYLTANIW
tara:strand:- start:232 stop:861 length:630 start_codon:yes stop_codon:yes gene_type:complete